LIHRSWCKRGHITITSLSARRHKQHGLASAVDHYARPLGALPMATTGLRRNMPVGNVAPDRRPRRVSVPQRGIRNTSMYWLRRGQLA